jgi:branched-subunit amino acid ABC-type transport system permease component
MARFTQSLRVDERATRLLRSAGEFASGPGIWIAIIGLGAWSAIFRTDAFVVGIVSGSILALGALGLTLFFGVFRFAHFAHGDSMMLSAYIAFFALTGIVFGERVDTELLPWSLNDLPGATDPLPWPGEGELSFGYGLLLAMIPAAGFIIAVFLLLEKLVYGPLRRRGSSVVIFAIASLGIAIAMRSVMLMFWGPSPRFYAPGIRPTTDLPFDVRVVTDQIFIFLAAVSLAALVYLMLYRTKLGKAMRAISDNADLARVSGIDAGRITSWTWIVGGGLVASAGVLLALQAQLQPRLGFVILLPLFAATILGGIGKPQGALVGGMIVGITQEVAVTLGFISPGYKFSVAFVLLIIILLLRPRGLFGESDQ